MEIVSSQTFTSNYVKGRVKSKPTCLDLFCGAGGLSLGFSQAGGVPVGAIDFDKDSIETYKKMFPFCKNVYQADIRNWANLPNISPDIIVGGPPCQGFSLARGLRFVDDPRNQLYKEFIRIVAQYQPSWVVMENVPGIRSIGEGVILQQIYEDFAKIGYDLECKVINMANYGVPQSRKRAIFVGNRLGIEFTWPEELFFDSKKNSSLGKERFLSVGDAISDLPYPMGKYFSHRANSQMRGPRNRDLWNDPAFTLRVRGDEFGIRNTPASGVFAPAKVTEPEEFFYYPSSNNFQKYMREDSPPWFNDEKVKFKLVKKKRKNLDFQPRRLAHREMARLQAFPDWFSFCGSEYSQSRQIGNAVPPLFAKQLFIKIFDLL